MGGKGKAHGEAARAAWVRKGQAGRAAHAAAVQAGMTAHRELAEAEAELAKRAGTPCPVCGRPVGVNGMCVRSSGCIDDTMFRVMPGYNPAALYAVRK